MHKLKLFTYILPGVLLLLLACSDDGSPLKQYVDEFNPILERQNNAGDQAFAEMENLSGKVLSGEETREMAAASMVKIFDRVAESINSDAVEWLKLVPPPEAESFHLMAADMMLLRIKAAELMSAEAQLVLAGRDVTGLTAATDDALDEADRMWIRVLAEARRIEAGR